MADENTANSDDPTNESEGNASSEPPPADETARAPGTGSAASTPKAMTPGQRLAAKQAAKAVQKRAFKEELRQKEEEERQREQAEADRILGRAPVEPVLPQNVERAASTFTHALQDNRERILLAVGALVLAAGVAIALSHFLSAGSREQANELAKALDISGAAIDPDDADGVSDDGKPLAKSEAERAEKTAGAFAAAAKVDANSVGGVWAKLGQAAAELRGGKVDKARAMFQSLVSGGKLEDVTQHARALEGAAIALEAEGKVDEATKLYEQLKGLEGEKMLAEYHLARLRLNKGDREGAKNALKALYDELNAPKVDSPPSPYLRSEVELRLAELDSSLVQGSSLMQPQQFSEEQLQRLIEQLQQGKAPGAEGE